AAAYRLRISLQARRYAAVAFCRELSFEDRRLRAPASDGATGRDFIGHLKHTIATRPPRRSPHWRTEMCSRTEAALRLIAAWLDRAIDDPDFPYRADRRQHRHRQEMDLLTEYSGEERQKKAAALDAETIRNQAMLRAWLVPKPKGAVSQ